MQNKFHIDQGLRTLPALARRQALLLQVRFPSQTAIASRANIAILSPHGREGDSSLLQLRGHCATKARIPTQRFGAACATTRRVRADKAHMKTRPNLSCTRATSSLSRLASRAASCTLGGASYSRRSRLSTHDMGRSGSWYDHTGSGGTR